MFAGDKVFRSLFGAYPDALLVVDASGSIVLANPAASRLLGYPLDELVGLSVDELVPDGIRPRHDAYRAAYARAPRARPMGTQMELVAKRRDGSQVMVEIALGPVQDHGLPYTVAAVRAIAAYPHVRQALQRARHSEQLAAFGRLAVDARDPRALLERAPRVVVDTLEVDAAAIHLLDPATGALQPAGSVGMPAAQGGDASPLNPPGMPHARVLAEGRSLALPGDDDSARAGMRAPPAWREDGFASELLVPLVDRGKPAGVLWARSRQPQRFGAEDARFMESLANLLMTTVQRARSEEALSHQQRLESVGQLTGGIAHDFNNLLTVISGNLQVLQDAAAIQGDAALEPVVAAAARAAARGAELTGKLLAFSRRQLLQPGRVDTGALVNSLAGMLRRTLDQRIRIEVVVDPACPPCRADGSQLESALLNIAINARDAMPDGGVLSFACRPAPGGAPGRADLADGEYVALAVADTGWGMPEAVRERAFEPFFTTKGAGRGTGLGLATVYGFVRQSDGAVTLDSAEGRGTTLTLFLPRWDDGRAAASSDDAPAEAHLDAGLRVLMVEDDGEVRAVVRRLLEALGCRVWTSATAEQALDRLASPGATFDLLLTDLALGVGMRGSELARRAGERQPPLPAVLMTGFRGGDEPAAPGWPVVQKPCTRAALARAIGQALTRAG